jgi:peptidoglycan hydrolase CwlO-like protein
MNLRTTTPVSNSQRRTWVSVIVAIVVIATVSILWINRPVAADQYDDKIRALQANMAQYQAEANRLNAEATTLSNTLAQISNEKNALQAQVNLSQSQYDQLIVQIADTEKQIADNQDALGSTLASLYVDDDISPIEMLASSKDISEFLNKQEYRNSIKKELSGTITRVKDLRVQLSDQKTQVETVLAQQKASRDELAAKEAEQARLVAETRNDEAEYQGLIKSSAAQIAQAKATQAALAARVNRGGGMTLVEAGSLGAYPWDSGNCRVDSNAMSHGGSNGNGGDGYGYGCRQCTSYVAWKIAQETGRYFSGLGNGGNFASSLMAKKDASGNNLYRNLGSRPEAGSVAVMYGNPGHVAWIEGVSADGRSVTVTQYNYNYGSGWGLYSKVIWPSSTFDQYVKPV